MSSVVPVAIAMLPENVEQDASAVASPAFWMVVVAEMVHSAAGAVSRLLAGTHCHWKQTHHRRRSLRPAPVARSS